MMKRASLFRKAKNAGVNLNVGLQSTSVTLPEDAEDGELPTKLRTSKSCAPESTNTSTNPKSRSKLNFKNLSKNRDLISKDTKFVRKTKPWVTVGKPESSTGVAKKKSRGKVDLEMMQEDLKQLEDPPKTKSEKELSVNRLNFEFYDVPCIELAQNLLGRILVRQLENGTVVRGRIVETESYLGEIDKASMTFENRVTPRNIPMYMLPGTIFVYMTYGMYYCFNVSSGGKGAAVLLRALEPLENTEEMQKNRLLTRKSKNREAAKDFRVHELCNGPSKLCAAFQIDRDSCKYSLCTWKKMWIEDDPNFSRQFKIVKTSRIGIDSVGPEWAKKPLRFYIDGSTSVSKRDKAAEKSIGDE